MAGVWVGVAMLAVPVRRAALPSGGVQEPLDVRVVLVVTMCTLSPSRSRVSGSGTTVSAPIG